MAASVAWISIAPVKGMRMQELSEVELGSEGAAGDRKFFLVDENAAMISATRLGPLLGIVPEFLQGEGDGTLSLAFPDGSVVSGPVELGEAEDVAIFTVPYEAKPVLGEYSEAISNHCETPLRLIAMPEERPGVDRGEYGPATILGVGSIDRLEAQATEDGEPGEIDRRRFRMNFGVDGIEPHEEDLWMNQRVKIGAAEVEVKERVGRCAATTRDPDRGDVDLKTLHHLKAYRGDNDSPEPLPFGVYATVASSGRIRLGDPVAVTGQAS
ncbi:MAG: MOSC domain-containing protein [Solirubrobacterales bacterium]